MCTCAYLHICTFTCLTFLHLRLLPTGSRGIEPFLHVNNPFAAGLWPPDRDTPIFVFAF